MRLARISSRVAASGASRSITSSNVRLASSIIAHSSPRISTPCGAKRAASTRCGSLPSCARPSALARRLAGSIVTTATRSPWAAMPIASAAEVVVLPTPPEPAQITIRLPSSSGTTDVIARTTPAFPAERRLASDQAFAHGVRDGLGPAAGVELGHDVVQDVLHGPLGIAEFLRDLARRMPLGDQGEHLLLALGEPGERGPPVRPVGPDAAQQAAEQVGGEDAGAAGRCLDRRTERLGSQGRLAQEAHSARLERGVYRVLARVGRAHDHARARSLRHRAD